MSEKISLDGLKENLDFFNKMYDAVRLVDPIEKRVIDYRGNSTGETGELCYGYWSSGYICDNCISVRANSEQKSFMKLEQAPNAIMLVTALPIDSVKQSVVLELLKNATDTMMIGTGEYHKGEFMYNAVQELNDMAIRDELTSLYNRRFLNERLPTDIIHATIDKKPISLIFIDVDDLKTVNDTLGHGAGDDLLKNTANTIWGCIRSDIDWVARYGGDEFLVCLNDTGSKGALYVSKRIDDAFKSTSFSIGGNERFISVSQGVVTMPESGLTAEELIKLADEKMYEDKIRRKENKRTPFSKLKQWLFEH